jgi:hypothetical protein
MLTQFCLYPISRISRGLMRGGADDDDFDPSILPVTLMHGATIENVSSLISEDEFEIYKQRLGTDAIEHLENLTYAIVHRSPNHEIIGGSLVTDVELMERSQNIVAEIAACLRLIRPTSQHAQMCWGKIRQDGQFYGIGFSNPLEFTDAPQNQRLFSVRTKDIQDLVFYAPLFRNGMQGQFWKFRMAAHMHEAGHFQNTDWKARFFLWTSALESLFTSKPPLNWREHSGSVVASERIKFFLGPTTPIYPPGELTSLQTNPGVTVEDVIGDIYCLRNHIAHGDKVPDCYFNQPGRTDFNGDLSKAGTLTEAISFIVRQSLLRILKDGLLDKFADGPASEAYFTAHGLTRTLIGNVQFRPCPS